jgi:hypothetical protein
MINPDNNGACFYDNCSTNLTLRDCIFAGGRFGVVFDQTEVSGIYTCEMSGQSHRGAGLWIVNGPDISLGNLGGFTNQITVDHNCQFNQHLAHAIIDDGGESHYFGNNNINGGGCKFAGVGNLTLMGGEFESVNSRPTLTFTYLSHFSKNAVGACSAVLCNGLISQPPGQPCILAASLYNLSMMRMSLTATGVAGCVSGTNNIGTIFARQNGNPNTPVPIFDGYASALHDDGYIPIRSTASTAYTLQASEVNALLICTADSAIEVTIPANKEHPFSPGTKIIVEQAGSGMVTLSPSAGVILNGVSVTRGQFRSLELIKTGSDRWIAHSRS